MNIHEYQAKAVLKEYGVPVSAGVPAFTVDEAVAGAKSLPGPLYVVKSQIHAGGRGKGKFKELPATAKGGVRLAFSIDEVASHAKEMLGNTLVTVQTGATGKQVNRLYIEDGSDIARELYLSVLVDRETGSIGFVCSTEGGMDIEQVAHDTPEKIATFHVDPAAGYQPYVGRNIAYALKLEGNQIKQCVKLIGDLYRAFVEKDMAMLEINPLIVTKQGDLKALDAKVNFDSNALFRHRGGRQGDRGLEVRPRLYRARRHDRLHGQRRRPRHGDPRHHPALRRDPGQLPRRRRWRQRREGDGGVPDHHVGPEREGHPGQHLRRHHEVRHHRPRRDRGGEDGRPAGAARRAPDGYQ
jgi:succinyl-CoA synthetase beta subunit